MPEVVCLGILVADLVGRPVRSIPPKGKLVLVDDMELSTGGCAVNTGLALNKLGISAGIIGKVGSDALGDYILGKLADSGLGISGIKRDAVLRTSASMVMVDEDGERTFIHHIGANAALCEEDVDWQLIQGARFLHIAGSLVLPGLDGEPTARVLRRAQGLGCTTSIDTAWDEGGRWRELIDPCLPFTDVFLPSVDEARMLSGCEEPVDMARVFLEKGVKVVGIKMGSRGSYVTDGKEEFLTPPFRAVSVDATGAGDAFAAGFIAASVKGWPLAGVAKFANAVGALATTELGATAGVRDMQATLEFMETGGVRGPE